MYYFMFVLGFIFLIWYNYNFYHVYNTSRKRALWYSLTFMYGMLGANIMGRIYTAICMAKNIDDNSRLAIFGAVLFAPVLILLTVLIEKWFLRKFAKKDSAKEKPEKKPKKNTKEQLVRCRDTLDMLTPGLFITLAFGKIGCLYEGCCFGIACSWGVYSHKIDATVFPVQLFEAFASVLMLAVCYFLKRTRFYRRGMAYPLTALLYCISRFCFEFLRHYIPELRHLLFRITLWQGLCIFVIVSSIVSLIVLYKTRESNPLPPLSFAASPAKKTRKNSKKGNKANAKRK